MAVAFVAGATGHTGRIIVAALASQGVHTVAHVRPDSPSLSDWRDRWAGAGVTVDATPWESDAMSQTLRSLGPTLVFAALGTTRERAAEEQMDVKQAYERIDYGLTAQVLEAAQGCETAPRFVYVSAAGLSATTSNPYMRARVRIEAALVAGSLPYLVARPSFIVGDRDVPRLGERWAARVVDGALGVAGALGARRTAARYRSTTNETLGHALVRLALDEATPQRHIAESEALR